MNMLVVDGQNSDMRLMTFGPGTAERLIRRFHAGYVQSAEAAGDDPYSFEMLRLHMETGHVVVCLLYDGDRIVCMFGLELMQDARGPYLQFMFIYGIAGDYFRFVTGACFSIWKLHAMQVGFTGEGRMMIKGRKGWRRIIDQLGIEYVEDESGGLWIHEYQTAFGYQSTERN